MPLAYLFNAFWKVLVTRVLSGLQAHRSATSAAFLSALLECLVFLVKRVRSGGEEHWILVLASDGGQHGEVDGMEERVYQGVQILVQEQVRRVWEALAADSKTIGLRVEQRAAARLVGQMLVALCDLNKGTYITSLLFSV
jgi:hypothetical protein